MSASKHPPARRARALALLAVLAIAPGLSGCVESAQEMTAAAPAPARYELARRADVSPKGAEIALASLDGAPAPIAQRFGAALSAEAGAREIVFVDPAKARYQLRGYLVATPVKDGVSIAWVWDIFGPGKARARRMTDELTVKAKTSADPWSGVDDAALASVAARSADDLAAFLSNTPEAIAAAKTPSRPARPARPGVTVAQGE